jgi:N-acetylglutamate synthase-like GNAT family acetyltransferase
MVHAAHLDPTALRWQNFTVATLDEEVIGIAQIKPYRDCREFGSLVVDARFRKQGVGKALIEQVLMQTTGTVYLNCRSQLMPYYAKFGFRQIGFAAMPPTLKLKQGLALLLRVFGIQIVCMQRNPQRA